MIVFHGDKNTRFVSSRFDIDVATTADQFIDAATVTGSTRNCERGFTVLVVPVFADDVAAFCEKKFDDGIVAKGGGFDQWS